MEFIDKWLSNHNTTQHRESINYNQNNNNNVHNQSTKMNDIEI